MDLTIDFTDLLKSFLVAFGPVLKVFLVDDLESADESESEASDSLSSSTNESS